MAKYLLGLFDSHADPEEIVATARAMLAQLGIDVPDDQSEE